MGWDCQVLIWFPLWLEGERVSQGRVIREHVQRKQRVGESLEETLIDFKQDVVNGKYKDEIRRKDWGCSGRFWGMSDIGEELKEMEMEDLKP